MRSYWAIGTVLLAVTSVLPSMAGGAVWTVRQDGTGDFATIGEAVAAASPSDQINVGPGVYGETVFIAKSLDLVSESGVGSTFLDGGILQEPVMRFEGGGTIAANVEGFTFRNGQYVDNGAAVRLTGGAAVVFRGCVFQANHSNYAGGAVFVRDHPSKASFEGCHFVGNSAFWAGGAAAAALGGHIRAIGCVFMENFCEWQSAGLQCNDGSMEVRKCLFLRNASLDLAGGIYYYRSVGLVENNTFHANRSPGFNGATLVVHQSDFVDINRNIFARELAGWGINLLQCTPAHSCNIYSENLRGPISGGELGPTELEADPIFCSPGSENFFVDHQSPAAPENNPCGVLIGAFDAGCGTVPVFVTGFEAFVQGRSVALAWGLTSSDEIAGFRIYRRDRSAGRTEVLNGGVLLASDSRSFVDAGAGPGAEYEYTLGVVLADGTEVHSQAVAVTTPAAAFELCQNVPNPFNPTTTIPYAVREPGMARLRVFDARGALIETLVDGFKAAGNYTAVWEGKNMDGSPAASGVYFVRLESGGQAATRKMVLLK